MDELDRVWEEPAYDRRSFLRLTFIGGMALGAAGLAGWLLGQESDPSRVVVDPTSAAPDQAEPDPTKDGRLAAAEDRQRFLQARLEESGAQVETLSAALEQQRGQLLDLQARLDSAEADLALFGGLLILYHQLEALELDALVGDALEEGALLLADLLDRVPLLRDGVALAAGLLDRLEQSLPSIQDGLRWLIDLTGELADALQAVEDAVEEAAEPIRPLAEKLAHFFQEILTWLPFGVGDRIVGGLEAMGRVLTRIPDLVRNLGPALLEPLEGWFDREPGQVTIKTSLIEPIRGQTL